MKKRALKNLSLNKKTVSKLSLESSIKGGAYTAGCPSGGFGCVTKSHVFVCCPKPAEPSPVPLPDPIPTSVFPRCNSNQGACPM